MFQFYKITQFCRFISKSVGVGNKIGSSIELVIFTIIRLFTTAPTCIKFGKPVVLCGILIKLVYYVVFSKTKFFLHF